MADYDDIRSYIMNDVASLYPNSWSDGGYFASPPNSKEELLRLLPNARYGVLKTEKEGISMADDINNTLPLPVELLPENFLEIARGRLVDQLHNRMEFVKLIDKWINADGDSKDYRRDIHIFFNNEFTVSTWFETNCFSPLGLDYSKFNDKYIHEDVWVDLYEALANSYYPSYRFWLQVLEHIVTELAKQCKPVYKSNNAIVTNAVIYHILKYSNIDPANIERAKKLNSNIKQADMKLTPTGVFAKILDNIHNDLSYTSLYLEIRKAGCVIPNDVHVGNCKEWVASIAIKALLLINEKGKKTIGERIANYKTGKKQRSYEQLANLYSKLAVREKERLKDIEQREDAYRKHLAEKAKYSLAQKIEKGKWEKDSLFAKLKDNMYINEYSYTDLDNTTMENLCHIIMSRNIHKDDHKGYITPTQRRSKYFRMKAYRLEEAISRTNKINIDEITSWYSFLSEHNISRSNNDNDWASIYEDYRKCVIKEVRKQRMAYYVVHGRTQEYLERERAKWESQKGLLVLAKKLKSASIPTSTLTITPKGKRQYITV